MGKTGRKRSGGSTLQVAALVEKSAESDAGAIFMVDWCECGNLVTPQARKLQDPDPTTKKKCFNCLLHERKVVTVQRTKDGWSA